MAMRDWEVRRSECRAVMARIRIEISSGTKVSLRLTGLYRKKVWRTDIMKESK